MALASTFLPSTFHLKMGMISACFCVYTNKAPPMMLQMYKNIVLLIDNDCSSFPKEYNEVIIEPLSTN